MLGHATDPLINEPNGQPSKLEMFASTLPKGEKTILHASSQVLLFLDNNKMQYNWCSDCDTCHLVYIDELVPSDVPAGNGFVWGVRTETHMGHCHNCDQTYIREQEVESINGFRFYSGECPCTKTRPADTGV